MQTVSQTIRCFPKLPLANPHPLVDKSKERRLKIAETFEFLALLTPESIEIKKRVSYSFHSENSALTLIDYLSQKCWQWGLKKLSKPRQEEVKLLPLPENAAKILINTKQQYHKATSGLIGLAPLAITFGSVAPALYPSQIVTAITSFLSNTVVSITAGFNTYVNAGNINLVKDEEYYSLQGSSQESAILETKDVYQEVASYISEMSQSLTQIPSGEFLNKEHLPENSLEEIKSLIHKSLLITKHWFLIEESMKSYDILEETARQILQPLAQEIRFLFQHSLAQEIAQELGICLEDLKQEALKKLNIAPLEAVSVLVKLEEKHPLEEIVIHRNI